MIQTQIAKILHLKVEAGDTTHSLANIILRRLKMRVEATRTNILLVLDDVWEKIDLDVVGIPSRDSCCKILLTTRSFDVCRDMFVDFPFQLSLMSKDDAWKLFVQSIGSVGKEHVGGNHSNEEGGGRRLLFVMVVFVGFKN
ncbi:probable disease resistance protein At4g14610 [Lactuca sativa]|uniref:probable disease resistance protein At4g14610 n=1 Tax=Lactuca sativa TaxID=4236 RepID=UPI000CD92078|nr:probable disease resistance protein At4g14610 [Lactuca sativa]